MSLRAATKRSPTARPTTRSRIGSNQPSLPSPAASPWCRAKPPQAGLTEIETENGTPNGYSAPGIIFLSPRSIGKQVNARVLSNQIARQWWGALVSPANRNHLWLQNGMARYSEFLYIEHVNGA